jgi:sec-independent protein translocase protein TatA
MGLGLGNPVHIALILVVLLLVFGAKRLPDMGRSIGSGLREFRRGISDAPDPDALPEAASVDATTSRSTTTADGADAPAPEPALHK